MNLLWNNYKVDMVEMSAIDVEDTYYRISRPLLRDEIRQSVRNFGIIEPIVLQRGGERFRVITGFNRIEAARLAGHDSVPAVIIDRVEGPSFAARVILKASRGELGPFGKVRALVIMEEQWSMKEEAERIGMTLFGLPGEFMNECPMRHVFLQMPHVMRDYVDVRDPGFRTLGALCSMPHDVMLFFEAFVRMANPRVNIFRSAVDLATDIIARDGSIPTDIMDGINRLPDREDRKKLEDYIHGALYRARYPDYTRQRQRADALAGEISRPGVTVRFPENFEGGSYSIVVNVKSGDTGQTVADRLKMIDADKCASLAGLL